MQSDREIDVSALIERRRINAFVVGLLALLWPIVFLDGYDYGSIAYAAPAIVRQWAIPRASLGPVFSLGIAGLMCGAILFAFVGDRFGRKRAIVAGGFLLGVSSLLMLAATDARSLGAFRFLAGVGIGGVLPNALALIAEYTPHGRRAIMQMTVTLSYSLGAASVGFVAAGLVGRFGWHAIFIVGGALPLVVAAVQAFALPESVQFLVLRKQDEAAAAILRRVVPEVPLSPGARFTLNEERAAGIPVQRLFAEGRAQTTLLIWLAQAATLMAISFLFSWLPTLFESDGLRPADAALTTSFFQITGTVGTFVIAWFLARRGVGALALVGVFGAIFVALLGVTTVESLLILIVGLAGFCVVGNTGNVSSIPAMFYPTYIRATGAGWGIGIGRLGAIVGPLIGGYLISRALPSGVLFAFAAIPPLVCAAACALMASGISVALRPLAPRGGEA